jgi:hypothetical protein
MYNTDRGEGSAAAIHHSQSYCQIGNCERMLLKIITGLQHGLIEIFE